MAAKCIAPVLPCESGKGITETYFAPPKLFALWGN